MLGKPVLPTQATLASPASAPIAWIARSRYIRGRRCIAHARGVMMRAEIQNIVDEIKQSVGLLRRHL